LKGGPRCAIQDITEIGVEHPIHLPAQKTDGKRIQRVVLAAPRAEPAFARSQGVSTAALRYWLYKLRAETGEATAPPTPVRIVPVTTRTTRCSSSSTSRTRAG
jgi:hypothetical protein